MVGLPVLQGRRVNSMGEGKLTPLTTPTPLNRQSWNTAHVITSTISPHKPHPSRSPPGLLLAIEPKLPLNFFYFFLYCTQNLSTDLELRPLNRFWHAIHQQTRIHAGQCLLGVRRQYFLHLHPQNPTKTNFWAHTMESLWEIHIRITAWCIDIRC